MHPWIQYVLLAPLALLAWIVFVVFVLPLFIIHVLISELLQLINVLQIGERYRMYPKQPSDGGCALYVRNKPRNRVEWLIMHWDQLLSRLMDYVP
jgi:hypothetical protein